MNVNRLIAPCKLSACSNSTIHPTQLSTSQVQNFKQKLLTMLKPSTHLSKKKNSKLITVSEWLTYKIKEDT